MKYKQILQNSCVSGGKVKVDVNEMIIFRLKFGLSIENITKIY